MLVYGIDARGGGDLHREGGPRRTEVESLRSELQTQKALVSALLTRIYGAKSEKMDHDQLLLAFLEDEAKKQGAAGGDEDAPAAEPEPATKRRKNARRSNRLVESLEGLPTIAEALKPAGYKSYIVGKWHVCREFAADGPKHNWPLQRGFDRFYGTLIAAGSQWDPLTLTVGNRPAKLPRGAHYTDVIGDKAIQFIEEHHSKNPFFLYVAHTAPHWPLHARDDVLAKYRGASPPAGTSFAPHASSASRRQSTRPQPGGDESLSRYGESRVRGARVQGLVGSPLPCGKLCSRSPGFPSAGHECRITMSFLA